MPARRRAGASARRHRSAGAVPLEPLAALPAAESTRREVLDMCPECSFHAAHRVAASVAPPLTLAPAARALAARALAAVVLAAGGLGAQESSPPGSAAKPPVPRVLPATVQVAAATAALPVELRAGAKVLGYVADGRLTTLREGSGGMICLASDPAADRFHVACYHETLEPLMASGRELRARGLSDAEVDSARTAAVKAGTLRLPSSPAALYSLTGPVDGVDPTTGEVKDARPLYVVYIPFATADSTGLSATPVRDAPWIMFPGTPRAHIMFAPEM